MSCRCVKMSRTTNTRSPQSWQINLWIWLFFLHFLNLLLWFEFPGVTSTCDRRRVHIIPPSWLSRTFLHGHMTATQIQHLWANCSVTSQEALWLLDRLVESTPAPVHTAIKTKEGTYQNTNLFQTYGHLSNIQLSSFKMKKVFFYIQRVSSSRGIRIGTTPGVRQAVTYRCQPESKLLL